MEIAKKIHYNSAEKSRYEKIVVDESTMYPVIVCERYTAYFASGAIDNIPYTLYSIDKRDGWLPTTGNSETHVRVSVPF